MEEPFIPSSTYFFLGVLLGAVLGITVTGLIALIVF
jgi:hypothetical protein